MGAAGLVNAAMLIIAAQLFSKLRRRGQHAGRGARRAGDADRRQYCGGVRRGSARLGLAASAVGTYAGQVVMAGFLRRRIPLFVRRLITAIPAIALLAFGTDPTRALVWSQVVLCFGIPFALIPLVWFTSRSDVMGGWANRRITTLAACCVAGLIIGLNAYLLATLLLG